MENSKDNNTFQAPQMILKDEKTYGLDKKLNDKVSYVELQKEGDKMKRTENKLETTTTDLAKGIKDGSTKVILPSKEFIREKQNEQFESNFKAPQMIQKNQQTYGLDKNENGKISYFELEKQEDKWKRTENKLETTASQMVKDMKDGKVKVLMASKEYQQEKENKNEQKPEANKEQDKTQNKTVSEKVEVKPIHIEPLSKKEREQVKEAFKENKLENENYAKNLTKKFEKQLNSVPDKMNGKTFSNEEKLKLLVGDNNDHVNTKYTVNQNKTISYKNDKEQGLINNHNSQFSEKQFQQQKNEVKQDNQMKR